MAAPTLQTTYTGAGGNGSATVGGMTIAAGSNQLLIIIASNNTNGMAPTPTWNGSSTGVTSIISVFNNNATMTTKMWYLANPTQTTANLAITGTTSNTGIIAYLFKDVDLSNPIGGTGSDATNGVATSSVTITTDRDNSIVVSGIGTGNAVDLVASGTNQTLGNNVSMGSGSPRMADSTQTTTTAGSYTQSFNIGGGTAGRALISAEIHGILDLSVSVGEDITVSESVSTDVMFDISVNDSVAVTENVTVAIPFLGDLSLSETITVSENISFDFIFSVNVSESISVTENLTMDNSLLAGISVSESISVTEFINVLRPIRLGLAKMRSQENLNPLAMDDQSDDMQMRSYENNRPMGMDDESVL